MELKDRQLKCKDCGADFIFGVGEQQFFLQQRYENEPRRCKNCRHRRTGGGGSGRQKRNGLADVAVTCSSCGQATTVPFKPMQGRPVYCRACFKPPRRRPD